jgi:hypothetical protein
MIVDHWIRARSAAMSIVRRGPREVVWSTPHLNLGNFLYDWMLARRGQLAGIDRRVLTTPSMIPWLPHFPHARPLLVDRRDVGLTDRRILGMKQDWETDFSKGDLADFIEAVLLEGPLFQQATSTLGDDDLVINIRRGDYYSNPIARSRYAIDNHAYLREVVATLGGGIVAPRIHVVSDGIDWCRDHLQWLAGHTRALTFQPKEAGPFVDFTTICLSRRLVITNTTFGYWGGYISGVLHPGQDQQVVAPWFHARHFAGGRSDHLNPDWTIIRDLPGGWIEPGPGG